MINKFTLSLIIICLFCSIGFSSQAKTKNPHGNLKTNCLVCHTTNTWEIDAYKSSFKHEETGFKLTKAHQRAACVDCHKSRTFFKVGTSCADCHQDVHQGKMGTSCESCHDNDRWDNRKIQQESIRTHQQAGFPLVGIHSRLNCSQCHANGQYRGTSPACYSCHSAKYLATTEPNHTAANYDKNCNQCHSGLSWLKAFFAHNLFPLTGAHKTTSCSACHTSGYSGTANTCNSCHSGKYAATTNPSHSVANFGQNCETCHNTTDWTKTTYSHNIYPLTGSHKTTTCASCHTSGYSTPPPNTCNGCHSSKYAATTNPKHSDVGYGTTCETCHNTTDWTQATFDHSNFPLTGAHKTTTCASCHTSGYSTPPPNTCNGCHSSKYAATTNPKHSTAGFNTTCQTCHSTTAWSPANFNHTFPTNHRNSSSCSQCHPGGNYNSYDCSSCHSISSMSSEHRKVKGYSSSACATCHPNGSKR